MMVKNDKTARKQIPAIFRKITQLQGWTQGTTNLDIGGGPYDLFTDALQEIGVRNLIYDPCNRSHAHNTTVLAELWLNNKCQTATISNVLNVIEDKNKRRNVLEFAKQHTDGMVYITVYEGDQSGIGGKTRDGYQLNRRLIDYLEEVQAVFPNASIKNGMISAEVKC